MLLDLSKLEGAHARFEFTLEPAAVDHREGEYRVASAVWLGLEVDKTGQKFRLIGEIRTTLELACGRCLDPFPWPIDVAFDLMYLPQAVNTGEGEIEVQSEDLATAFYRDQQIDLGQLMREQFYLALPMKPLCAESCRGLCPECGINLNRESCTCVHQWEDPRFAGLKGLLDR